jgi:ATP-binding cassette subfamily B protein
MQQPSSKSKKDSKPQAQKRTKIDFIAFFKPYTAWTFLLIILVLFANGLGLLIPKLTGEAIDLYNQNSGSDLSTKYWLIGGLIVAILGFTVAQITVSTILSEKVAKDLRQKLLDKLSKSSYRWVLSRTPSELLTNFTSDVDSVKNLISQGLVQASTSIILLFGSVFLILSLNLKLGLIALSILPIIVFVFVFIFSKIGSLFRKSQEIISKINKVINESVIASMLVRVLNSQKEEEKKFEQVNIEARDVGYRIIDLFSSLIPVINLVYNLAVVLILWYGGNLVVNKDLSIGQLSAFFAYYGMFITPIFILGFISNLVARSTVSLNRINEALEDDFGKVDFSKSKNSKQKLSGKIEFKDVSLEYGKKFALKNASFVIQPNSRNAILGPTAAGKTQILNLISRLIVPTSGEILLDGKKLETYEPQTLYSQMGLVFQDSILFNSSLLENILLDEDKLADPKHQLLLQKAIETSNLEKFVDDLPHGLQTDVSERGSNLSGGQKQRIMLARSLALDPKILLLDDFTARVDLPTERKILASLGKNYPDLTLVSITQKIQPVMDYDQIILVMEGEILATGTHKQLLKKSVEYQQIWESQQVTEE